MKSMMTQYAGMLLNSPIIVSSSGLTRRPEKNLEFEKAGAGAIVLKSLFEEQIEMQGDTLLQDEAYPEAADYIRGYVKANQIGSYLDLIHESKRLCSVPIIASINCYRAEAWTEFAKQLEEERRSGLFDGCDKRFIKSYEAAYAKKFREGFEKGRREVRLEVASNMLKYGADTDFIKKYTHLSDEEIAGLRK